MLYNRLNSVLEAHAPLKIKRIKYETQPDWFSEEIKLAIKERNILKNNKKWLEYKQMRNKVNAMIRKTKKKDFYNKAVKNLRCYGEI